MTVKAKLKADGPKKGRWSTNVKRGTTIETITRRAGDVVDGAEAAMLLEGAPFDWEPDDAEGKKVHAPALAKVVDAAKSLRRAERPSTAGVEAALLEARAARDEAMAARDECRKLAQDYADRMATGGVKK